MLLAVPAALQAQQDCTHHEWDRVVIGDSHGFNAVEVFLEGIPARITGRTDLEALGQTLVVIRPNEPVSDCDLRARFRAANLDVAIDVKSIYETGSAARAVTSHD